MATVGSGKRRYDGAGMAILQQVTHCHDQSRAAVSFSLVGIRHYAASLV